MKKGFPGFNKNAALFFVDEDLPMQENPRLAG
jgi:hypothetical protein